MPKKFNFLAEIGQAIALPENKKYKVRITVGGVRIEEEP
jgi:hypothetical protein